MLSDLDRSDSDEGQSVAQQVADKLKELGKLSQEQLDQNLTDVSCALKSFHFKLLLIIHISYVVFAVDI